VQVTATSVLRPPPGSRLQRPKALRPQLKIEGNFPIGVRNAPLGQSAIPIMPMPRCDPQRTVAPTRSGRYSKSSAIGLPIAREGQKLGYVPLDARAKIQRSSMHARMLAVSHLAALVASAMADRLTKSMPAASLGGLNDSMICLSGLAPALLLGASNRRPVTVYTARACNGRALSHPDNLMNASAVNRDRRFALAPSLVKRRPSERRH
jgi:hypothetical protein